MGCHSHTINTLRPEKVKTVFPKSNPQNKSPVGVSPDNKPPISVHHPRTPRTLVETAPATMQSPAALVSLPLLLPPPPPHAEASERFDKMQAWLKPRRAMRMLGHVFKQATQLPRGVQISHMGQEALDNCVRTHIGDVPLPSTHGKCLPHEYLHHVLTCPAIGLTCSLASVEACFTYDFSLSRSTYEIDYALLEITLGGRCVTSLSLPV